MECRQIGFLEVRQLCFRHSGESRNPEALPSSIVFSLLETLDSGFRRNDGAI